MVRSTTLVGLAALSVASAEPLPKRGSFKLPLTRRAVSKVIDDSSLTDIYTNTDWTTEVSFGGQKFSLQVDTGSSDIWVLSSDMSSNDQKQFPSNHFFDSSKSKSFKSADGATFNITYDAGEIFGAGKVGKDDVSIGKLSVNMPFGLGSQVTSHGMVDKMYDGMLGLAFGAASTQKPNRGPTFMEAIQSQLDAPVFTWHAPLTGAGHMLEFGHVDKNLYDGDLKTAKVNNGTSDNPVGWMTQLTFSMGGKNISSKLESAVVDTGGLAAQASQDTVAAYWGQVKGAMDSSSGNDGTLWLFPCNAQLPDLTYDFLDKDGKTVSATVPGKFFNSTQQSSDPSLCVGAFTAKGASGVGQVGYPFLHSFFTVFDQSVPSVSFASYKKEELDGKALEGGSSTTATSEGLKPHATGNSTAGAAGATGTGAVHATSTPSSGSAAASASPSASGSAPGGSQHSGATGLQPSVTIAMVAAVLGLFA